MRKEGIKSMFRQSCEDNIEDIHMFDLGRGHEENDDIDDPRRRLSKEVDDESASAPTQKTRCDHAKPLASNKDTGKR